MVHSIFKSSCLFVRVRLCIEKEKIVANMRQKQEFYAYVEDNQIEEYGDIYDEYEVSNEVGFFLHSNETRYRILRSV